MIRNRVVVSRYAEAFMGLAKTTCGVDKALQDLAAVKNVIRENSGFGELMDNPEISHSEKCAVIDAVIRDGLSEDIRNFLKLLLEKKRFGIFLDVAEYLRAKYAHHGQLDVLIKTAFPLDLELIERIEKALRKKFQQELRFYIDLDGSLLGGVQVVIGNTIIDGSVLKRLTDLGEKLSLARME
ncbi:MAG: ATP synthase F1 subunit delta [Candidatus Omnitrophica bacterium]|nr:ATP synthase F1 subunit delta [Candidatus Omnitrophota bacterium]MDD5042511.1 ATP synthase F1 subunit delta [Candidatus Omnitrophota bacterium]MDD5500728.1 ATP synthase F1 subunit delta [Candidatus Omnitrophota bacterium]